MKPFVVEATALARSASTREVTTTDFGRAERPAAAARRSAAQVYYRMGIGYENEGCRDEAMEAYAAALRLDPGCDGARRRVGLLTAALDRGPDDVPDASRPRSVVRQPVLPEGFEEPDRSAWAGARSESARTSARRCEVAGLVIRQLYPVLVHAARHREQ